MERAGARNGCWHWPLVTDGQSICYAGGSRLLTEWTAVHSVLPSPYCHKLFKSVVTHHCYKLYAVSVLLVTTMHGWWAACFGLCLWAGVLLSVAAAVVQAHATTALAVVWGITLHTHHLLYTRHVSMLCLRTIKFLSTCEALQ